MRLVLLALVVLAGVVAVSGHAVDQGQLREALAEFEEGMKWMQSQSTSFQSQALSGNDFAVPKTQALTAECTAALSTVSTTWQSTACVTLRAGITVDASGVTTQAQMSAWCTSTCLTDLRTALDGITTSCSATTDRVIFTDVQYVNFVTAFKLGVFWARGVCVQSGTQYCWPTVQAIRQVSAAGYMVATSAQVSAACDDACVPIVLRAIGQFGHPALVAASRLWNLVCLKDGSTYCFPILSGISAASVPGQDGRPNFAVLCQPCFMNYINSLTQVYANYNGLGVNVFAAMSSVFSLYCAKAGDGEYCYNKFLNLRLTASSNQPCDVNSTVCAGDCLSQATTLNSRLGCCLGSIFQVIGGDGDAETFLTDRCGLTLTTCSGLVVKGTLKINNFLYAYYQAHKAAIDAAIKADLAIKFGLIASMIAINAATDATTTTATGFQTQATNSAVSITYTVTPGTSSQATSIASSMSSTLTADPSLPTVATVTIDGRADPTQAVSADASASTASTATNPNADPSAAAHNAASLVVATVAAVAALLMAL